MEKANVIKALEICGSNGSCSSCPYHSTDPTHNCDQDMCADAIALLKGTSEAPKANTYPIVYVFTKKANLLPYFSNASVSMKIPNKDTYNRLREYYAKEREVQLLAMFRWERTDNKYKCICRIKCPINPMPVKEEFETPGSTSPVLSFLKENGWEFKQKINTSLFK